MAAAPLIKTVKGTGSSFGIPCSEHLNQSIVIAVVVCKVLVFHVFLDLLGSHVASRYVHPDAFRGYNADGSDDIINDPDFVYAIILASLVQFVF